MLEIRESKLYRVGFGTFEEYCKDRWGMDDNYAGRIMRGAAVVESIAKTVPIGTVLPQTESQVRPLTRLSTPALQQSAWTEANRRAQQQQKPVTAAIVETVVTEYQEEQKQASEPIGTEESEPQMTTEAIFRSPFPKVAERGLYLPSVRSGGCF